MHAIPIRMTPLTRVSPLTAYINQVASINQGASISNSMMGSRGLDAFTRRSIVIMRVIMTTRVTSSTGTMVTVVVKEFTEEMENRVMMRMVVATTISIIIITTISIVIIHTIIVSCKRSS